MARLEIAERPPGGALSRDRWLFGGLLVGLVALLLGIGFSGAGLRYFFQPSSALIVFGGTLGITLVTSPKESLRLSCRRVWALTLKPQTDRAALIEEVVDLARVARRGGLLAVEPLIPKIRSDGLRNGLTMALDARDVAELQTVLENEIKLAERHGQADAIALETAAGCAPTVGILGTVVGLIEVLRGFSDLRLIGPGIGAAFVSTIYGLLAANFVLLPLAHRIHARVAEACETQELVAEGVICIFSSVHPSIVRQRLALFLRETDERQRVLTFQRKVEVLTHDANAS